MASKSPASQPNTVLLKNRIRELEDEVAGLKHRMETLRRAKNTTLLKREREVVQVRSPLDRRECKPSSDPKVGELQKKLKDQEDGHERELEEIRSRLSELSKKELDPEVAPCDHASQIETLHARVKELEGDNGALLVENKDLGLQIESLYTELSVKEAKWCETEEDMTSRLQIKWQEMYRQWMAKTEAKINELQQANALLQRLVRRPSGGDGQSASKQ